MADLMIAEVNDIRYNMCGEDQFIKHQSDSENANKAN